MRLGLIGLKGHQNVVLNGARELGDVQLVAVSEDSGDVLAEFMKKEPLAKGAQPYRDWRHLLEHTMMDVCCICDENGLHAEQLIALYERNIDIVTEKPLATTLADLDRIRAAAAKSKSRMTMLLTMRHEDKYGTLRELVRGGAIGEVCQATLQKSYRLERRRDWFKKRERLGGTIPYIGIHPVDMLRWTTGLEPTHVSAFHGRIGKPEMGDAEDHASLLLKLNNGASATIGLDYLRPETAPTHGDDRLRLAGTEGIIEVQQADPRISLITSKKGPVWIAPKPTNNLFVDFVRSIQAGRPWRIPAEDCFRATEIVLRARDAADQGTMVSLKTS